MKQQINIKIMYTASQNKQQNIETAKSILSNIGLVDFRFCDYSDSHGVSVYFLTADDKKIRVSDHSVTSSSRMQNEILFSFDMMQVGIGGTLKLKDNQKMNTLMAKNAYKII